jgi:hypothetical protein
MTARGGFNEADPPLPQMVAQQRARLERIREAEAAERERIARIIERLDNTMMDQAKLAAYIRGQETP